MKTVTQRNKVLSALKKGRKLTPLEALRDFGCFRLGARIWELRADGYNIARRMVEAGGSRVAQYRLVR